MIGLTVDGWVLQFTSAAGQGVASYFMFSGAVSETLNDSPFGTGAVMAVASLTLDHFLVSIPQGWLVVHGRAFLSVRLLTPAGFSWGRFSMPLCRT